MARPDETMPGGGVDSKPVEHVIGMLLRSGVMLSAAVVLVGGILFLFRHGFEVPDYRHFSGEPASLRHLDGILSDIGHGNARGIIQLGLILLIATPVMRVAFTAWVFIRQRDRLYVAITLLVLAILALSLLLPDWEAGLALLLHR